ncbi:MAG: hypothetical protein HQM10_00680 [Candidatus Riflebacteria bacterium]|nr:hypothetical protein [Candidatus Riflebacteria bacterium]
MELFIKLTESFLESPSSVISILQLSKKLDIPYGTAYNRIHQLEKMGIICISLHGKAKLCTLNSSNPMSSTLLALGSAKKTSEFFSTARSDITSKFSKLRDVFDRKYADSVHTVILLNPETLAETPPSDTVAELPEDFVPHQPFDFFLIIPQESGHSDMIETALMTAGANTVQIVTPGTLLGMFCEKENDAGLIAYHMLRKGLIITGFERFFNIVLKAFPPPNI